MATAQWGDKARNGDRGMHSGESPTFVRHLECAVTGERHAPDRLHGLSAAGTPLLVRYDLKALAEHIDRDEFTARKEGGLWRYRELLPVREARHRLTLGEVTTPLLTLPRVAEGRGRLRLKDESRLPMESFKARGLALAVSMAKELAVAHLALVANGSAGVALAAYAASAGLRATVFCPADTPEVHVRGAAVQGAEVYRVDGLMDDCCRIVTEGKEPVGWFDITAFREPYRIEGSKTAGLELAEQLGWRLPDAIFCPTGSGSALVGMGKAFDELECMGWIGPERPRMFAVQASGCAPIVRAFENGTDHAEPWQDAHTVATGIRVPATMGDFLVLQVLRACGGHALAVDDEAIEHARTRVAREEGVLMCPEGAAAYAAWEDALRRGLLEPGADTVLLNCASGFEYPLPAGGCHLSKDKPIDYGRFRTPLPM
jgi:threonine synthase